MNGPGAGKKETRKENYKLYEVEVSYLYRDTEIVHVAASCQGKAKKLALEIVEDRIGGEDLEINHIEEVTKE